MSNTLKSRGRWRLVTGFFLAVMIVYGMCYLFVFGHRFEPLSIRVVVFESRTTARMFFPAAWCEAQIRRDCVLITTDDASEEDPFDYAAEPLVGHGGKLIDFGDR